MLETYGGVEEVKRMGVTMVRGVRERERDERD
jgi:hypothetical protein